MQAGTDGWILGLFFSPSALHTTKPGRYLLPAFAHQFRCLIWDVNLSAKWFNIIFVTITYFQRPLQMAFLIDLKIRLPIKRATSTQFVSYLLLGEPAAQFSHKSFRSKAREDFVNLDLWAPSYWLKNPRWICVTMLFPSPLGKQRMYICRKSGLFPLSVRSYQEDIEEGNLPPPYPDNQTTPQRQLSMICRVWKSNIYKKIHSNQRPQTKHVCSVSVGCQGKRIAEDESSETRVKGNATSFTGQHFQKSAGFHPTGWALTTSLHPVYPVLSFSAGWDRGYLCEPDNTSKGVMFNTENWEIFMQAALFIHRTGSAWTCATNGNQIFHTD